jgi:prepilin-type N-terminal cleavage/methylation domain-containing protein
MILIRNNRPKPKASGFSLIELTVVLLIMAIIVSAVVLQLSGPMHNAQMRDVIARVVRFDSLTRTYAGNNDLSVRMEVDLNAGEIRRMARDSTDQLGRRLVLPSGFRITRLVLGNQEVEAGSVSMSCSQAGLTPSYALEIGGPGGRRRWLVFAGLTGQMTEIEDDKGIEEIWTSTVGRNDAG